MKLGMSHLEITVFLWENDNHMTGWADMLRDIAEKLETHHIFTEDDKWYGPDGNRIAQFHEPKGDMPHIGSIHGLN